MRIDTNVLKFTEARDYSGAGVIRSFLKSRNGTALIMSKTSHEKVDKEGIPRGKGLSK